MNKEKMIKVECCEHCPLSSEYKRDDEKYCTHQAVDGMLIENPEMIHPDCPLENVE